MIGFKSIVNEHDVGQAEHEGMSPIQTLISYITGLRSVFLLTAATFTFRKWRQYTALIQVTRPSPAIKIAVTNKLYFKKLVYRLVKK